MQYFTQNEKNFKTEAKNAFLGFFSLKFDKTIVIFEITTLEIVKMLSQVVCRIKNP